MLPTPLRRCLLPLALVLLAPAWAEAQNPPTDWDPARLHVTRDELADLLAQYESVASSSAYSGSVRESARQAAERIRERLEVGDFRVGDRIWLDVREVPEVPDTLVVEPGPSIVLPEMGTISLRGVLRSELQAHLEEELSRYIQNPTVRSQSLIRMEVRGAVGSPGFYVFPSDLLLSDVFTLAGGPNQATDMEDLRIQRGTETILQPQEVTDALAEGRSLDQLGLRAGDIMVVAEETPSRIWPTVFRWSAILASSLLLGVRIF